MATHPADHHAPLTGRIALVTASSRGIGAATARALAAAGAAVAVNGREVDPVHALVEELQSTGHAAHAAVGDAADPAALHHVRETVEAHLGPISLLALVAGGGGRPMPLTEQTPGDWHATLSATLDPAFVGLREFLPGMIARRRGSVVAVASTAGQVPTPAAAGYAAGKAGVLMLVRHTALAVADHGVRVNAVSPGTVTNTAIASLPADTQASMAAAVPLRRLGTPADIAEAIVFLLGDAASWITGATLDVNGGQLTR
jgi:3-oxoacyl-[acyl-carrier protein] reductase